MQGFRIVSVVCSAAQRTITLSSTTVPSRLILFRTPAYPALVRRRSAARFPSCLPMSSQRPARSAHPARQSSANMPSTRPKPQQHTSSGSVTFQPTERGDRAAPIQSRYPQYQGTAKDQPLPPTPQELMHNAEEETAGGAFGARMGRKKSLVKPDREKIEPGHRQWYYRNHVAQMESEGRVMPSSMLAICCLPVIAHVLLATGNYPQGPGVRRGKSLLAREEDLPESGLSIFKRSATLRRRRSQAGRTTPEYGKNGCFDNIAPGPKDPFMIYSWCLTCCVPPFLLSTCGIRSPEQQRAWREKMGLLSFVFMLMAGVGFLTFGFTQTVCGKPPLRYHTGTIDKGSLIINGFDYDFSKFNHPAVPGIFNGQQNPLFTDPFNAGGMDASFLFQNVNNNCRSLITASPGSSITVTNGNLGWYFPCNFFNQIGTSPANKSGYDSSTFCHADTKSRQTLASMPPNGQVYYTWPDVKDPHRNLAVYES